MLIVIDQLCWLKRRDPKFSFLFSVIFYFRYSVSEGISNRFWTSDMPGLGGHQSDTMSPVKILNQIRSGMSSLCKREPPWLSFSFLSIHSLKTAAFCWLFAITRTVTGAGTGGWGLGSSRPRWQTANNICATFTSHVAVLAAWQPRALPFAVCDILIAFAKTHWTIRLSGGEARKPGKIRTLADTLNTLSNIVLRWEVWFWTWILEIFKRQFIKKFNFTL